MNITLISTETESWSFGLRSISATLKAAGYKTQLIFMGTNEQQYLCSHLEELTSLTEHSDIIGISCLARGSEKAIQIIRHLHLQKKMIIWGGVHACLNPAECADWADIVCRGEGEGVMLELIQSLENEKDWKNIDNIGYKENDQLILNNLRPPILNLDDLPFPDFSFENEFHLIKKGIVKVSTFLGLEENRRLLFNSSRGCAFHCTYCCNEKIKGLYSSKDRYVRRMSISKLIEHTQNLRKIFPMGNSIYFIDEDFAARPVSELIQFSIDYPLKVGLPFECLAHPARITHEKMKLLVKAGLYRINIGIESGSERTRLEIYNRKVSNDVMHRAAEIISCYSQVLPKYFFIISNPYEEKIDLLETIKFITSLPYGSYIQTYNLVFFPGSTLYENAVNDGYIKNKFDSGYELNFLGGFDFKKHGWKRKNLYLNGIIFLMEGTCTKLFVGSLPRFLINQLIRPDKIVYFDKSPLLISAYISLKIILNRIRHFGSKMIKKITGNPTAINFEYFLRRKVFNK